MAHVWIPLPDADFDVTEVAVPWKLLTRVGHRVTFVTETGEVTPAFVVEDGDSVSARWPGDAYLFARKFISKLPGSLEG